MRDTVGLITASRDPDVSPPRSHIVRTRDGNRWLLCASLSAVERKRLGAILSVQPRASDPADAESYPFDLGAIGRALAVVAPLVRPYRGPAFSFPDELPSSDRAELLTDLREAPREGPFAWLRSARDPSHPIAIVRADSGDVASVCYSARSTSAAAEAGVETREEHRGRGYGSAAVLTWSAAVRQSGRVPLYSTEWENTASRALASRLGLLWYAEDLQIR